MSFISNAVWNAHPSQSASIGTRDAQLIVFGVSLKADHSHVGIQCAMDIAFHYDQIRSTSALTQEAPILHDFLGSQQQEDLECEHAIITFGLLLHAQMMDLDQVFRDLMFRFPMPTTWRGHGTSVGSETTVEFMG
jgi:hypothetical protein